MDIQKKYYEALELIYDKSEEVCPPIPIASQGVVNNQGKGGEGSSNGSKRKRKGSDGDLVPVSLCDYCKKPNHSADNCWKKNYKCFSCRSSKHLVSSCPHKVERVVKDP